MFFRQFHKQKVEFSIFQGKFSKNFDFLGNFRKKNRFYRKTSDKSSIFSGNFTYENDFSGKISEKF